MKTKKTFAKSLALLLLTACLVIGLVSCEMISNLFSKDEPETTPVTESTTPEADNSGDNTGDNTGDDMCDLYYFNFVESFLSTEGITLKIKDLTVEVETNDTTPAGLQKINSVEIAELEFSLKDGELYGAAHGKISITFFDTLPGTVEFSAILSDGYLYFSVETDKQKEQMYQKHSLEKLFGESFDQIDQATIDEITAFAKDTLLPMVESLIENNKASIDNLLSDVLNIFFTFEEQSDGSVLATLSKDKLLALNEALSTKTIAEVVDIYFGEGTFDDIADFAFEILDLKVSEIPAYLKDKGFDYDGLVVEIQNLLPLFGAPENFDINAFITNSDFSNFVIGELIVPPMQGYENYKAVIEGEILSVLRENNLYKLIDTLMSNLPSAPEGDFEEDFDNSFDESFDENLEGEFEANRKDSVAVDFEEELDGNPEEDSENNLEALKTMIDNIITQVFDFATLSFSTEETGAFTATHITLTKLPVGGSSMGSTDMSTGESTFISYTYLVSFSLDILANSEIEVTWGDIIDKINNALVPAPDELKEEMSFNCESNDLPYEETIYFQDKEYNAMCYDVWVSMADFDTVFSTVITPDCGDWLCYDLQIAQKEYDYRVYFVESNYETLIFLGLGYEGVVAQVEQVSGGFNVTYENGETKYIIMATEDAMLETTAKLFPLVFEGEYEIYETQDYVTYYYNTKTHDYGFYFSQHEYEVTYNKLGETCNDGYEIVYTCSGCGDSYTEGPYYGHEIGYFEEDLCDFGLCGGYAYEESCMICGEVERKELSASVCYWRMLEDTDEYISYKCNSCGTVKTDRSYTTNAGAICQAQFVDLIIFTRDGKELYKYENIDTIENHTYRVSHYEKLGESCEDGYIARNTCIYCGDSYTFTSDRHTSKNLTKTYLSSLGVCGGYIERGTCDICNLQFDADYYLGSCKLETIWQEMYSVTEQCTKCGISVVTIYGADPYVSIYYKGEEIYRHYGL